MTMRRVEFHFVFKINIMELSILKSECFTFNVRATLISKELIRSFEHYLIKEYLLSNNLKV